MADMEDWKGWNNKWRPSGSGTTRRLRAQQAAQERDRLAAQGDPASLKEKAEKERKKAASMEQQAGPKGRSSCSRSQEDWRSPGWTCQKEEPGNKKRPASPNKKRAPTLAPSEKQKAKEASKKASAASALTKATEGSEPNAPSGLAKATKASEPKTPTSLTKATKASEPNAPNGKTWVVKQKDQEAPPTPHTPAPCSWERQTWSWQPPGMACWSLTRSTAETTTSGWTVWKKAETNSTCPGSVVGKGKLRCTTGPGRRGGAGSQWTFALVPLAKGAKQSGAKSRVRHLCWGPWARHRGLSCHAGRHQQKEKMTQSFLRCLLILRLW